MEYYNDEPLRHVGDVPAMSAERYGGKLAFEYRGEEYSYHDLEERSNQVANALQAEGVTPDDRVAVYIENSLQFPETFFGTIKAGAVPVPLNHRMDLGRLAYVIDDSGADYLVGSSVFAGTVHDLYRDTDVETVLLPGSDEFVDYDGVVDSSSSEFTRPSRSFDDVAVQPYTSGTTGDPKGVLTSHRNLLTTVNSYRRVGGGDPEKDSVLVVLPLFHMFGLSTVMLVSVYSGASIILKTLPVASSLLEAITEHEITSFGAVPAIFIEMVREYEENPDRYDVSSIERLGSGAAPLAEDTRRRIEDEFETPLVEGWGMTETSPAGTIQSSRGVVKGAGCIGQPLPDLEMKLVDPDTRETRVPADYLDPTTPPRLSGYEPDFDESEGVTGEIAVRGPQIFQGYHDLPNQTDAVFDDDGWFYTGDIARVDEDRYLWMVDRADDMIIVGGENVYPAEVENALFDHPDVEEAAVVAAPHDVKGEAPVAFVVLGHGVEVGVDVTEDGVREFVLERVASYAHPRRVFFVDSLPRSGTQKVQRYKLETEAGERVGELTSSEQL